MEESTAKPIRLYCATSICKRSGIEVVVYTGLLLIGFRRMHKACFQPLLLLTRREDCLGLCATTMYRHALWLVELWATRKEAAWSSKRSVDAVGGGAASAPVAHA